MIDSLGVGGKSRIRPISKATDSGNGNKEQGVKRRGVADEQQEW